MSILSRYFALFFLRLGLDVVTLDALRSAPQRPVIEKKNGVVASVKLVKFVSAELEESERNPPA